MRCSVPQKTSSCLLVNNPTVLLAPARTDPATASPPFAQLLPRILQQESHAPIGQERRVHSARRPEGRTRARLANLGWGSPSVRSGLNIRQEQGGFLPKVACVLMVLPRRECLGAKSFLQSTRKTEIAKVAQAALFCRTKFSTPSYAATSRVFDGSSNHRTRAPMFRSPSATSYTLILHTHSIAP